MSEPATTTGSNAVTHAQHSSTTLGALKASMMAHPVVWTIGGVAVVGFGGYLIWRAMKKPASTAAAS